MAFPMGFPIWLFASAVFSALARAAQQYPLPVTGQTEIKSPHNPNITVRYKTPGREICRTAKSTQKQFTGYIHLPPLTLAPVQQNYPINTYFWFVEAQEKPESAPLTIWLNGGPGSSSMIGLFSELGPCEAVPVNRNSIATKSRAFSWDKSSNMLFIDQPNQVGLSYDTPTNGTLSLLDQLGEFMPGTTAPTQTLYYQDLGLSDDEFANLNLTAYMEIARKIVLMNGTFPSGIKDLTPNTTEISARSAWHFLQTWLVNFPQYNPNSTGINLFAESYGGKYGPKFSAFFEEQNERRAKGQISGEEYVELHLESLGIINGCVDAAVQVPEYPRYANSNPYGIKAVSDSDRDAALSDFYKPGGCLERITKCRSLMSQLDSDSDGDVVAVNTACSSAEGYCDFIRNIYFKSMRSYYDITTSLQDPFPPTYYTEYLNNATVQQAIGAPINFTMSNGYVFEAFQETGDFVRGGELENIAYLLSKGVKVSLIYGDRDYICNYKGGEAVSLAINYTEQAAFRAAGYQDIRVNSSYIGGQVRQHGNFSFVRVYQAGHLVPSYQPETAYVIFDRMVRGVSIATGESIQRSGNSVYSTTGGSNTTTTLDAPEPPAPTCFVRNTGTCSDKQIMMIAGGKGVIYNGVLYNSDSDYVEPPPITDGTGGSGGSGGGGGGGSGSGNGGGDGNPSGERGSGMILDPRRASLLAIVSMALALALVI